MAIFNKIITFKACDRTFSYITKAIRGIEKCVYEYLDGMKIHGGLDNVTDCEFRLIFHGARELKNADQEFLKASYTKTKPYPIIHLTTFDIFEHDIPDLPSKRYISIMDSGIWNYYVPLEVMVKDANGKVKKDQDDKPLWQYDNNYDLFIKVLEDISRNKKNHLYDLAITHEHADLNARLLEQSHLEGSHNILSPFLFHSETEMRKKIDDFKNENEHNISINNYRWRFLLLDDKSVEKMSGVNDQQVDISKLQIIANNLRILGFEEEKIWFRAPDFKEIRIYNHNKILDDDDIPIKGFEPKFGNFGKVKYSFFSFFSQNQPPKFKLTGCGEIPSKTEDVQIVIDCVKHVDAAQWCLQKYKYDIILLDYLLDHDKDKGTQEYGYQLLEKLQAWHKEKKRRKKNEDESQPVLDNLYQPGPNGRFFFMFISAFTTAVHERMLAEGFPTSEPGLWFIGDGACPTNTPYLFAYQLLLFMRHRIADLRKEKEAYCLTLIELLYKIFMEQDIAGPDDIREYAHEHFSHLLFMRDKYKQLENDLSKEDEGEIKNGKNILLDTESSLLVQSAFRYVHHFSGSMFEHLQHMVYLMAFGTIRQWTELWEEYVFIQKTLTQYDELTGDEKKPGHEIVNAMRKFIINLKENSN